MNKRLLSIAVMSLSVSAVCGLVVVWASATAWVNGDDRSLLGTAGCATLPWMKSTGTGERRSVDLAWDGSDAVKVRIPARVQYQPGPKAQANVSGDADLVGHVRLRDGTLEWDTAIDCFPAGDLVVRLTGPAVTAWTLNGSGELQLADLKQDQLRITMHGSGKVTASGEVHELSLDAAGSGRAEFDRLATRQTTAQLRGSGEVVFADIKQQVLRIAMTGSGKLSASGEAHDVSLDSTGSGRADLGRLVTQLATARIRGSGDADLAPREDADISVSGSGVVRLHGTVAQLHSHVSGSGEIRQVP
jgi:hypothetical protein